MFVTKLGFFKWRKEGEGNILMIGEIISRKITLNENKKVDKYMKN